ncbi:hypothetical protein CWC05_03515 [Pseudoalteromonas ruthenica]|uniref:Uncharacterized protein n=1 Tax=Pseudoalteromonas ruthenica TaxID=151081 RepID=A0A5S3Z9E9_9GAMM|nr:hypothetical protein [Pseudoalteromonas ruthenica]TMP88510.1 hypothetical protein CWC05_03515 [Pseudoalteromonas ruthenica]
MDSIARSSNSYPFADPIPLHFGHSKAGIMKPLNASTGYEYMNNPLAPGRYVQFSEQFVNYIDDESGVVWSSDDISASHGSLMFHAIFFYEEGGNQYAIFMCQYSLNSDYHLLRINLADGSQTLGPTMGQFRPRKFFLKNGQLHINGAGGGPGGYTHVAVDLPSLSISTPASTPDELQYATLFRDGRVELEYIKAGQSSNSTHALRVIALLDGVTTVRRGFGIPQPSAYIPYCMDNLHVISHNVLAISGASQTTSTGYAIESQKYWDYASVDTWLANVIAFYTGYQL